MAPNYFTQAFANTFYSRLQKVLTEIGYYLFRHTIKSCFKKHLDYEHSGLGSFNKAARQQEFSLVNL